VKNSLVELNPELSKQWNYEKNCSLTPNDVTCHSNKKVWWKCEKGHEWEATVSKRSIGQKCPYCQGRKVSPENSLATTHPHLTPSWDAEKNYPLTPNNVSKGSERKVWWKCEKGHGWEAVIYSRANGRNCPYCSNKIVNEESSLLKNRPDIAESWNYEKNQSISPSEITAKSNKKVWWICKKGHEWEAPVFSRTSGCDCPYCANKLVTSENSLEVNYPEIASSWP
jgi:DNA-directed RNA polymerase subunit RPC12/RpoP